MATGLNQHQWPQSQSWRRRRKWLRRAAVSVSFVVLLHLSACWLVGGRLVRPAMRPVGPPPPGLENLSIETVSLPSPSGSVLSGWWIDAAAQSRGTIILLHPVRSDRRAMLGRALLLHQASYATLLIDLQAHGESPGDAITMGHRERFDARATVKYARERSPNSPIGVVGWSLGGAAALLGSPLGIDALAIESVYPTIEEATENRVAAKLGIGSKVVTPVLLAQWGPRLDVSRDRLQPIRGIRHVDCPLLILAGDQDYHTTLEETERMHKVAKHPKRLHVFSGAGHEDLLRFDPSGYEESLLGFFEASFAQRRVVDHPATPAAR